MITYNQFSFSMYFIIIIIIYYGYSAWAIVISISRDTYNRAMEMTY